MGAPTAASEFLRYWALCDRGQLAAEPERVVEAMDAATRQVIYVAAEDLLDDLADQDSPARQPGEVIVYLDPKPGEEYRWQLAAMLADAVVLNRSRRQPYYEFHTLRELCRRSDDDPRDVVAAATPALPAESRDSRLSDDVEAILDELMEMDAEIDYEIPTAADLAEWRDVTLPGALANSLRFFAHLSAVGEDTRVELATPDLDGAPQTWESLKGVYFVGGQWGVHDSWVGGPLPPGVRVFEEVINEIQPMSNEFFTEVMGSYVLGATHPSGHLPLVPSTPRCRRTAAEFYGRFRRLFVEGYSLIYTGYPQAEPVDLTTGPDWRPAFCDEMLLAAFPNVATADISTFDYLHRLPHLEDFRHRLRADSRQLNLGTAGNAQECLSEISLELRKTAEAASVTLSRTITSDRRNLVLTSLVSAIIAGVGFISFGPVGAIGGGLAAGSLMAALQARQLDRSAKFTGTELALMTLDKGRRPHGI
jgi:hypothetical protein